VLLALGSAGASPEGGSPRIGRADLAFLPSFTTAARKTARRRAVLDSSVRGRFGRGGEAMTAAFVRVEVTSRWPLVTGGDVRDNSGYNIHLVARMEEEKGGRVPSRLRVGDSSYRLVSSREVFTHLTANREPALASRLPDRPALSAEDLDGDGADEILAFFRRQIPTSARPEVRLDIFRIEGRALVNLVSIPVIVPDVSADFDFWGYLVGEVTFRPAAADHPAGLSVTYARTISAEDQRTDSDASRDLPPRDYTVPPLVARTP